MNLKALWLQSLHIDFNAPLWPVYRARLTIFGLLLLGFSELFCVTLLLASCGLGSPIRYGTPGGGLFANSIKTIPADTARHITGLPYPRLCSLGNSNGRATPDKVCTPGSADGEVIVASLGNPGNVAGTICTPGWTRSADALAQEQVPVAAAATAAYNVRGQALLVHLVPLNLGGSNDASNLLMMPIDDAKAKQNVDAVLSRAVCAGTISLGAAQNAIANNWTTAASQLGLG
jgi:hypothetical protein